MAEFGGETKEPLHDSLAENTPESYLDPLSMTRQEFDDYWTEKLSGFHKGENFDPNNKDLMERIKIARANKATYESYLIGLYPDILKESKEKQQTIDALLGQIWDKVQKNVETPDNIKIEAAREEIRGDIEESIVKIFATLNYEKVDFANELCVALSSKFPDAKISVERKDDAAYECNVGNLVYIVVLGNQRVPMRYEKFYRNAKSFMVKENIKPAVGLKDGQDLLVVEEGTIVET